MPKVSVCVPVYNVEQYIGRCIESIQNQTLSDIEIIVVNDCTSDNSMQIVEALAKRDPRIKIINHERNMGLMCTRKTGYMAAKGDYITFCDSDDTLTLNAVELLYNKTLETGADIVCGNICYLSVDGKKSIWENTLKYGNDSESVYRSLLLHECGHNVCSKLFKRELLQENEYLTYDHFTNGEDGCLFYQVVENSSHTIAIKETVYNYFQNSESSSQVRLNERGIKSIAILNKIRVKKCSKYRQLDDLLFRFEFKVFNKQLASGYGPLTRKYAVENGLQKFLNYKEALHHFSITEMLALLLERIRGRFFRK